MYGKPRADVGREVDRYYQNFQFDKNPEELGQYADGDILIPRPTPKNGVVGESYRWPNGVIPFEIRGTFSSQEMQTIKTAIAAYHKNTCIKFVPRKDIDKDYVSIQASPSGCWSSVGRTGGQQIVNLQSPGCLVKVGTAIHELMHAVGFLHEQNRPERDEFVAIQYENVQKGAEVNFAKAKGGTSNGFGVSYDYGSIMHYSMNAFSSNGQATIVPLKSTRAKIGQREDFSSGDKQKIWNMYNCKSSTSSSGFKPDFASAIETVPNIISGLIGLFFPDESDAEEIRNTK
ncbi:unnamed protein product [Hermetia illucens]|uniref:Metalloendopeptidase n=2 Tax=Hermetia illucens TaxID=343691 RepID=A0A7R8V3Z4_HERIL|nr:unnamed protein product [Hermetia illucens]